jgi:hypothetical protein
MRALLALLAVMALLISPVAAGAAQAQCALGGSAAMAGMDMPAMSGAAHAGVQKAMGDPCCDQAGHHKMSDKSCAQACAASCVATVALPASFISGSFVFTRAPMGPPRAAPAVSYQPFGLERPPKSMA